MTEDGETEPYMSTCTYSSNQLIIKEIGGNKQTRNIYVRKAGESQALQKTYPIYEDLMNLPSNMGRLFKSNKGIIESEYPTTEKFLFTLEAN